MPLAAAVAEVHEMSDLMDKQLALRLTAYREGWQAAELAHAADYDAGYVDGLLGLKHAQHDAVEAAKLDALRWGPRGHEHYSDPRLSDAGRGEATHRAAAAWEPYGLPPPGMVHLSGSVVHHHQCQPVCHQYAPGWYSPAEAAGVLARLPGNYAETIAELRAMASAPHRKGAA